MYRVVRARVMRARECLRIRVYHGRYMNVINGINNTTEMQHTPNTTMCAINLGLKKASIESLPETNIIAVVDPDHANNKLHLYRTKLVLMAMVVRGGVVGMMAIVAEIMGVGVML
jgi:hypothetical protein